MTSFKHVRNRAFRDLRLGRLLFRHAYLMIPPRGAGRYIFESRQQAQDVASYVFTQLLNGLLRGWAGWKRLEQIERTRHSLPPASDLSINAEVIAGELLRFAVGHGQ